MKSLKKMERKNSFWAAGLAILIILLNQTAEYILLTRHLILAKNQNLIFGLGPQMGLFLDTTILIILFLAIFIVFKTVFIFPLATIIGGALSNLIDRFFRGGVLDFFQIKISSQNIFFNVADIIILLGVIIYFIIVIKQRKHDDGRLA